MENKRPKTNAFGILLIVVIGVLATGVGILYKEKIDWGREVDRLKAANARYEEDSSVFCFRKLLEIDDQLLRGRYREALSGYRELRGRGGSLADSIIDARVKYASEKGRKSREDTPEQPVEELAELEMDSVSVPKRGVDSTGIRYQNTTDSLSNRIAQLNRQLRDRNRALEEKERREVKIFQNAEGATINYIGEVKNDMANGGGTGMWESSGGVYNGQWVDNQRHGYGVYTWSDGVRYEGNFSRDKREGHGTYTWTSGERYEGAWKNNKRHGQGILYDKDGNISYKGLWEDDKPKKE